MPWKLRYTFNVDYVPPGTGPMEALSPAAGVGIVPGGSGAQTKGFVTNYAALPIVIGGGAGQTLVGGDVTTLTNAMAADAATQINAALAQINGFATGSP